MLTAIYAWYCTHEGNDMDRLLMIVAMVLDFLFAFFLMAAIVRV